MSQLELLGGHPTPPDTKLTERQRHALDHIGRQQPVTVDEVGALLHQYRKEHGGRGHDADARCDWCPREGRDVLQALRKKGLVVQKRGVGWCLTGWTPPASNDPLYNQFPEGF